MILTPEYIFRNVEAIRPEFLARLGVRALVLDVDNTLTGDGSQQLDASVQAWLDAMRAAGVSLTIVSNNTARRVRPFAGSYNTILLQNHGLLCCGKNPEDALCRCETAEHIAQSSIWAELLGNPRHIR